MYFDCFVKMKQIGLLFKRGSANHISGCALVFSFEEQVAAIE